MATNFEKIQSVFIAALERSPDSWEAYLAETCGDNQELRQQVRLLLQAHQTSGPLDRASPTLASNTDAAAVTSPDVMNPLAEKPGSIIGRYKLLQQIGEGGFGVVYMADQETPVKRRVALKVIKAGMDTHAVIARFEAERQALAMMDHPNIARVLDAGATATGRPYFVMELVKGIPITDYCDQANLSTRQRLELFVDVCRAVQHAHQKGIIHRDLKPSNIMVTLRDDRPNVKVIDFGIAKATEQMLTEKTLFTNYGQIIGTPVYMSPEQAAMSEFDVDTRSDVYSLGVLLYELLAGSPPFDAQTLRKAGFDEMRRIIREDSPQKPSNKLNTLAIATKHTVAAHRQASPEALSRQLNGDLDWIVLKAIEKDRTRRYESASAFAQDIERHLNSEAVFAGAPGRIYKLRRFAKRNKAAFAVAAIIALVLVVGTAVSIWQAVRATRAGEAEATQRVAAQQAEAQAVAHQQQADSQRQRADAEKLRAEGQLSRAERLLYASKLLLAQIDFEAGSGGLTQHYLDECKPSLRGWEYRYLLNRITPTLALTGHTQQISSAAFSPDGSRIVTTSHDRTARVWDAATGKQLFTLPVDRELVLNAAFSPDGKQIVTGGGDWGKGKKPGEVKVWNAATGGLISDLKGHEYCVWSVAFDPDGKRVISGAADWVYGPGEIKVWDVQTAAEILAIRDIPFGVHALAISPDGTRVASGGSDGSRIWNTQTGKLVLKLEGESNGIRCIAYSRDGKRIATGNETYTVIVWDSDTGKKTLTLTGHSSYLRGVAFSPDGKTIATASGDKTARVWDAQSGLLIFTLKGHTDAVRSVAFSRDGMRLVTASNDKTARLWDAVNGQEIPVLRGHKDGITGIAFSSDSQRVADCSYDGFVKIWNANTNLEMLSLRQPGKNNSDSAISKQWAVAFSPDGRRIVAGGQDKNANIWDTTTGKLILALPHVNAVSSVAYSPDGTRILTGMSQREDTSPSPSEATIWNAQTGQPLFVLKHPRGVWSVAFSRDGSRIVTGSGDNIVRIWDANTGKGLVTLAEHVDGVSSVAFSPDTKRIVTASRDRTARVWDAFTGKERLTLAGHTAVVRSAVFSPDGERIVTGSDDMSIKLWNAESGEEVFVLHDLPQSVYSVAFSPDGKRLAAGFTGIDGTVRLWYAPPATLK